MFSSLLSFLRRVWVDNVLSLFTSTLLLIRLNWSRSFCSSFEILNQFLISAELSVKSELTSFHSVAARKFLLLKSSRLICHQKMILVTKLTKKLDIF